MHFACNIKFQTVPLHKPLEITPAKFQELWSLQKYVGKSAFFA
jgi:hypothetical protein